MTINLLLERAREELEKAKKNNEDGLIAKLIIDLAERKNDSNPELHLLKADYYELIGHREKEIKELNKLTSIDPENPISYARRGILLVKQNNPKALEDLNKALELGYENKTEIIKSKADIFFRLKEYEKALNAYKTLPQTNSTLNKIGLCQVRLGNLKDAKKYFLKTHMCCDSSRILSQIVFILRDEGEYEEAFFMFNKYIKQKKEQRGKITKEDYQQGLEILKKIRKENDQNSYQAEFKFYRNKIKSFN